MGAAGLGGAAGAGLGSTGFARLLEPKPRVLHDRQTYTAVWPSLPASGTAQDIKGTYAWELADLGYASRGTMEARRARTSFRVMGRLQYTHLQNPLVCWPFASGCFFPAPRVSGVLKVTVDLRGVAKGGLDGVASLEGLRMARDRRGVAFCGLERPRVDIFILQKW